MKIKNLTLTLLILTILLLLTGCGKEMTEYTTFEYGISEQDIIKPEEIIEVNREEKIELYKDMRNFPEFEPYGNTIEILSDEKYGYLLSDENVCVRKIQPASTEDNREINLFTYQFKQGDGKVETYLTIDVIEDNKLKTITIKSDTKETKTLKQDLDIQDLIDRINGTATASQTTVEYLHTNSEGLDTIKLIQGANFATIRFNPKTGEVHYIKTEILEDAYKSIVAFKYTDTASIKAPTDYTDSKFDVWFYTKKYLANIKVD